MFKERITELPETLSECRSPLWLSEHRPEVECGGNAGAPLLPMACPLFNARAAQLPFRFPLKIRTFPFQNFPSLQHRLCVEDQRDEAPEAFGGKQEQGQVPGSPPDVRKKEFKAEEDFFSKLKNKKLTSRKSRVRAERLPQRLRFFRFQIRSP